MSLEQAATRPGSFSPVKLLTALPRLDSSDWRALNWLSRWFVMVRAPVLVMTLSAVLSAALLALHDGAFYYDRCIALTIGLLLAHATNNLINDWVDHRQGTDRDNYFRHQYGTHVLEDALITELQFALVTLGTGLLALGCGIYLYLVTGPIALYLTIIGAFFVLFYTWPLKHLALGELAVLLVWGPLIIAGSYAVFAGTITLAVLAVSVVSGIAPTLVILAKHMDKSLQDQIKGIKTLPVVLGNTRSRQLCFLLIALQWLLIALIVALLAEIWLLVCLLSGPALLQLIRQLRHEPPSDKPRDYPDAVWPLWYTASAFVYARNFGLALITGLSIRHLFS